MKGKKFLAILGIFSLAVLSFGLAAIGATSVGVTATVTPQNISVTVTDGAVSYGTLDLNTSRDTVAGADTQTATNNGNVNELFYISSSDAISSTAGINWNLEATTGENQYVHQFSTNSGVSYTNFPANNSNALIASVGPSLSQPFDLKTTTPTSTTGYEQRNITVTVLATAL